MKKLTCILESLFLLTLCFSFSADAQTDTLTILHVNDTHSHLVPWGPKVDGVGMYGGIARAATLIGQLMAIESNPLLLHGGDIFVGDFMFNKYLGVAELQLMQAMGFDAMVLGNHEFDIYPSTLEYVLSQAGFPGPFPILSANLDMSAEPNLVPFVDPYTIKDYGDLRVGIFGLTTEETNLISNPTPVIVESSLDAAVEMVDTLNAHGCDIIICLSHLGYLVDQILASMTTGIDVIVGGHSHTKLSEVVQIGNTYIVQAECFYKYVGKLRLGIDASVVQVLDYELLPVDNTVPEESTVAATVQTLIAGVESDSRYGPVYTDTVVVIGSTLWKAIDFSHPDGYMDTPLGNMVADAYRDTTHTDIALVPQGFLSQDIYEGWLTGADIFQAIPYGYDPISGYGFKLATFTVRGDTLWGGLTATVALMPYSDTFLLNPSGMSYVYDSGSVPPVVTGILVGGQPLNPSAYYTVTTSDAVAGFLDYFGLTVSNLVITDLIEYNIVKQFLVDNPGMTYAPEGRVIDSAFVVGVEPMVSAQLPKTILLAQNYPNPFNPETVIRYQLPSLSPTLTSLKIFNTLGQEVRILVDEAQPAGSYRAIWDGKNNQGEAVATGVYIYLLQTGNETLSKKMVLLR